MRTRSQIFADDLKLNPKKALSDLNLHGLNKTKACFYVPLIGIRDNFDYWLEAFNRHEQELDSKKAAEGFTNLLSSQGDNWKLYSDLARIFVDKIEKEDFKSRYFMHFAAYFGVPEAFDLIEEKYRSFGMDYDWNLVNPDNHTPLYLSVLKMHVDTSVEILKRGGNPDILIPQRMLIPTSTKTGKSFPLIDHVIVNNPVMASEIRKAWEAIRVKHLVEKEVSDLMLVKTDKKNKKNNVL